jgi:glycosyltransferase involved in cell wall biosynthesis
MTLSAKGGPWRALKDILSLRRQMLRGIDVVHCHLSHDHLLGVLARAGSTALVRTVHAARAAEPRPGARWLWRHSDGIIARTPAIAEASCKLLGPAHRGRVTVVPGAIEGARWAAGAASGAQRAAWRARLGIPPDAPALGHVALMAERGQMELLRAFEQVWARARARREGPLPHLIFVGRGYQEVPLRWAVGLGELAGYVHFTGYVAQERLPGLYAALEGAFVAQPGNDGAARAALEAQAAGVPVIGVTGASLGGALSPEVAYLAPNRTPEGLASALEQWLLEPAQRRRRGALGAARMAAERSPDQEAAATLEVYAGAQRLRRNRRA